MRDSAHDQGLLDTNILILRRWVDPAELPNEMAISACAEHEFDPIPFGVEAARIYGRVTASVVATGRRTRRRTVDLKIAATAIAEEIPLFTTNPSDFHGLHDLLAVVPVARPLVPHETR